MLSGSRELNKLRPYQTETIEWLCNRERETGVPHAYLAHDVGTGKTVTTIGFLNEYGAKSALIVCPPKIKDQNLGSWANRMVEWGLCNANQIGVIRDQLYNVQWNRPFTIIGWQMACKSIPLAYLREKCFDVVILDEARALKALTSQTSQKILSGKHGKPLIASGRYKLLLDGTPMPNRPIELFPPAKVLAENLLGRFKDYHAFGQYFCVNEGESPDDGYNGANHINELGVMLQPFLNRLAIEDIIDLPPITFNDVYIDIGACELDETNTPEATLRHYIGMKKLPFAVEFLKEKLAYDQRKLLIYTHHRDVNKELTRELKGISILGGMNDYEREAALKLFEYAPSDVPLIASIRAMGDATDGIQRYCSDVVKVEMDWSAGQNNQAVGRIKRDGQESPMNVWRLIAIGTRDEAVLGVHHQKNRRIRNLFSSNTNKGSNMFEKFLELMERLVAAVEAMSGVESEPVEATGKPNKGGRPSKDAKPATDASAVNAETGTKSTMTLEDARKRQTELAKVMDDEKAAVALVRGILGKFGYKAANDVKDKDLDAYCAKLDEAIAAAKDAANDSGMDAV